MSEKLTLAQAIRAGAAMTQPLRRDWVDDLDHPTATCALGAAWLTTGELFDLMTLKDRLLIRWPLLAQERPNPFDGVSEYVYDTIIALNDQCGWTREAIADWVESLKVD